MDVDQEGVPDAPTGGHMMPTNYYAETLMWMHSIYIGMFHERCKIDALKYQAAKNPSAA
tara:strand:+ start:303 stop:479 length:177 start_codon:yes stop_codon:yes gene_type:complete